MHSFCFNCENIVLSIRFSLRESFIIASTQTELSAIYRYISKLLHLCLSLKNFCYCEWTWNLIDSNLRQLWCLRLFWLNIKMSWIVLSSIKFDFRKYKCRNLILIYKFKLNKEQLQLDLVSKHFKSYSKTMLCDESCIANRRNVNNNFPHGCHIRSVSAGAQSFRHSLFVWFRRKQNCMRDNVFCILFVLDDW